MKTNKLINKAMTLALVGATILGSSSSLYAKTIVTKVSKSQAICKTVSKTKKCNLGQCVKSAKANASTCKAATNTCKATTSTCKTTTSTPGTNTTKPTTSTPATNTTKPTTSTPATNTTNTTTNTTTSTPATNTTNTTTSTPATNTKNTTNTTNTTTSTNVSTQAAYENKVLELVNVERAKQGLKPLQMDESVRNVARLKSQDMNKNSYFSHTSPTYGSPFDMLKKFGVSYKTAGENIAQGYKTPEAVVIGWMNSPGHRANILNASFTHLGVGYEATGSYWTQMFIGK